MEDYQSRFLVLLSRVDPLTERQERQLFTSDLAEELRVDVELQDPGDLEEAMSLARMYEKKATCLPRYGGSWSLSGQRTSSLHVRPYGVSAPTNVGHSDAVTIAPIDTTVPHQIRRFTPTEMAERRRQGLCFNCDEKYVHSHRSAHLFFIEYDDIAADDYACGAEGA